jgi:hypothetical protein
MQRNIRISFFVLFFIPSFTGLSIITNNIQKAFKHFCMLKAYLNSVFSRISSGLFNFNHSQYLKDTVYQNYHEMNGISQSCVFLFRATIKQSLI